jgi:hypothetical protein
VNFLTAQAEGDLEEIDDFVASDLKMQVRVQRPARAALRMPKVWICRLSPPPAR